MVGESKSASQCRGLGAAVPVWSCLRALVGVRRELKIILHYEGEF